MLGSLSSLIGGGTIEKGKLTPESGSKCADFDFKFNPNTLKYVRSVDWESQENRGGGWPLMHYSKGSLDKLDFTLLLDETESTNALAQAMAGKVPNPFALPPAAAMGGAVGTVAALALVKAKSAASAMVPKNSKTVTADILKLQSLSMPDMPDETDATLKRPPFVTFSWGDFTFVGYIKTMTADVVLFDDKGNPKRATVALSLEGVGLNPAVTPATLASREKINKAAEKAPANAAKAK
jgi:hypothetical protein